MDAGMEQLFSPDTGPGDNAALASPQGQDPQTEQEAEDVRDEGGQ